MASVNDERSVVVFNRNDNRRWFDRRSARSQAPRERKRFVIEKVAATSTSESEGDEESNYVTESDDDHLNEESKNRISINSQRLNEMIAPMSSEFYLEKECRRLEYLCAFFAGASRRLNGIFRQFGSLVWLASLFVHFAFDVNEAIEVYGYTYMTSQGVWITNFIVGTLAMRYRVMPWLLEGLQELRRDECYEKTITNVLRTMKKTIYIVLTFGFVGSGAQMLFLYIDNVYYLSYKTWQETSVTHVFLYIIRYLTAVHVYSAYMLFWLGPTLLMLMCGYSMAEFLDQFDAKIRDTKRVTTFKEAISLYSKRAKFVKISSSKCLAILSMQILAVIVCFGLNTYVFLFSPIRRYLHVWHSIVPLLVMIYPLCTAAWVTKQYTWFIIVVVRAWVHREDLDSSSSDEDSGIEDMKTSHDKKMLAKNSIFSKKKLEASASFGGVVFKNGRPKSANFDSNKKSSMKRSSSVNIKGDRKDGNSTSNIHLSPWQKTAAEKQISDPRMGSSASIGSNGSRLANTVVAAKAINRFRNMKSKPRFNFEKFLSYLESMRSVVGFTIAGVMVTWDLVSTTLFLLFSIIAVFMQESIFGNQDSTLT